MNSMNRLFTIQNVRQQSRIRAIVALVSVSVVFMAAAKLCPECLYVPAEEITCNAGSCVGAAKITSTPAYKYCESDNVTSDFECFSNTEKTVVYTRLYRGTGGSPCPSGCTWSPYLGPYRLEVPECWNDDTGCGGNG